MSISTTCGDDGTTGLFGGGRVPKDHPRIEALGALDELTAFLGDAKCAAVQPRTQEILDTVQREIFVVMGILSSPGDDGAADDDTGAAGTTRRAEGSGAAGDKGSKSAAAPDEARLTAWVRELETDHPMRGFIVPGSCPASAKLDIALTIARRAERRIITLGHTETVRGEVRRYMNRL